MNDLRVNNCAAFTRVTIPHQRLHITGAKLQLFFHSHNIFKLKYEISKLKFIITPKKYTVNSYNRHSYYSLYRNYNRYSNYIYQQKK